ncbi:MAG: class I SAM-dependent methyltransferase [Candidatus Gracilibacteria bacterium]
MKCKICHHSGDYPTHQVQEMMFGFKDFFTYFECLNCGCLQIAEFPKDVSKYYPPDYCSFSPFSKNPVKRWLKKQRDAYALFHKGFFKKWLHSKFPNEILEKVSRLPLTKTSNILDVGCGIGSVLYSLRNLGFMNTTGVDPFIDHEITYSNGLKIFKKTLSEMQGTWDFILFHHSFEHIPNPQETIQAVSRLLAPGGICMISIPVFPSFAWEHYGSNWVQWDAPRHFFLHSVKSLKWLLNTANLHLQSIVYDSTDFQFWGSEQYLKGIPLKDPHSYGVNPKASLFSKKTIREFQQKALALNATNKGDQATFYITKNPITKN